MLTSTITPDQAARVTLLSWRRFESGLRNPELDVVELAMADVRNDPVLSVLDADDLELMVESAKDTFENVQIQTPDSAISKVLARIE